MNLKDDQSIGCGKLWRKILIDTLRSKDTEILGSPKPLNLDSLRSLNQRWGSPQATLGMPYPSCINASSFFS
jgi:hypothetical protein